MSRPTLSLLVVTILIDLLLDAHASLGPNCFACHAPFTGTPAERCVACHKVKDIGLRTTEGTVISGGRKNVAFHQGLVSTDCIACHSDHRGMHHLPHRERLHGLHLLRVPRALAVGNPRRTPRRRNTQLGELCQVPPQRGRGRDRRRSSPGSGTGRGTGA